MSAEQVDEPSSSCIDTQMSDRTVPCLDDVVGVVEDDLGEAASSDQRVSEPPDPCVDIAGTEQGETGLVAADVTTDLNRQRRWDADVAPSCELIGDQDPPDASVAVRERMDGLELGVGDGAERIS